MNEQNKGVIIIIILYSDEPLSLNQSATIYQTQDRPRVYYPPYAHNTNVNMFFFSPFNIEKCSYLYFPCRLISSEVHNQPEHEW